MYIYIHINIFYKHYKYTKNNSYLSNITTKSLNTQIPYVFLNSIHIFLVNFGDLGGGNAIV